MDDCKLEACLEASPAGLAELSEAVETALASPGGRASIELVTPDGDEFTLHIIRKLDSEVLIDEQEYRPA